MENKDQNENPGDPILSGSTTSENAPTAVQPASSINQPGAAKNIRPNPRRFAIEFFQQDLVSQRKIPADADEDVLEFVQNCWYNLDDEQKKVYRMMEQADLERFVDELIIYWEKLKGMARVAQWVESTLEQNLQDHYDADQKQ